jgi:hypothetical protein
MFAAYVGAFFWLSDSGVTKDRNGARMKVRIFSNHRWLCTVFDPLVLVVSKLGEPTYNCYRPPRDDPRQR